MHIMSVPPSYSSVFQSWSQIIQNYNIISVDLFCMHFQYSTKSTMYYDNVCSNSPIFQYSSYQYLYYGQNSLTNLYTCMEALISHCKLFIVHSCIVVYLRACGSIFDGRWIWSSIDKIAKEISTAHIWYIYYYKHLCTIIYTISLARRLHCVYTSLSWSQQTLEKSDNNIYVYSRSWNIIIRVRVPIVYTSWCILLLLLLLLLYSFYI